MNYKSVLNFNTLFYLSCILFYVSCNYLADQRANLKVLPSEIRTNTHLYTHTSYYAKEDITIHKSAVLTIESGVKLTMCDTCKIYCEGSILAQGRETKPIEIGDRGKETKMYFNTSKLSSKFNNTYFNNTSIYLSNISFSLDSCFFNEYDFNEKSNEISFVISANNSNVHIINSFFTGNNLKEGIGFNRGTCTIVNNKFYKHPDAIELSNIDSALVSKNQIEYSNDDGIDLNNCKNILITNNSIRYSKDKGLSIGNRQVLSQPNCIKIDSNLISNNKIGIAVKNNSLVEVSNCILVNNEIGLFFSEESQNEAPYVSIVDSTFFKNNKLLSNSNENPRLRFSNCFSEQWIPGDSNL